MRANDLGFDNRNEVVNTDEHKLLPMLKQLSISLEQYQKNDMQSLDLSPAQALLLSYLLTSKESLPVAANMHEELGISRATISLHLKKLRRLGYIQTDVVSADNRKKEIILTQKAYDIEPELEALSIRQEKCLGRGIPKRHMDRLEEDIRTMLSNIQGEMNDDMHRPCRR